MGFLFQEESEMKTIDANARPPTWGLVKKDPVKLTALLYLREALIRERYEGCAQFILVAKEFGASEWEIEELLEDARRTPR